MKTSLKTLVALALVLTFSCDNEAQINQEEIQISNEFEGATDCYLSLTGVGICLDGPKTVIPGETYTYTFKISSTQNGNNINEVVNWTVEYGEMEILDIKTTLTANFTTSIATIKFRSDFNRGLIKASSDRSQVDSPLTSDRLSYITYPISVTQ